MELSHILGHGVVALIKKRSWSLTLGLVTTVLGSVLFNTLQKCPNPPHYYNLIEKGHRFGLALDAFGCLGTFGVTDPVKPSK